MKLTVLACPDHRLLESRALELMKKYNSISENGAAVIVPDQSSFSEEERLIAAFGTVGLGNPEVLSFKRLHRRLSDRFGAEKKRLSAAAREMAVMHSLNRIASSDFRLFRGVINKRELSSTVSGLITGFKRYGVTAAALRDCAAALPEGSPLQRKVHDCFKSLESYDAFMTENGLCDAEDDMWELSRLLGLKECTDFEGRAVFISRFSDLNRLQLCCVEEICRKAEQVFVSVIWEDRPEFATTKKLINSLKRTAQNVGGDFELLTEQSFSSVRPEPLTYLCENYYNASASAYEKKVEGSIFLHMSKDTAAEVRHVAASITRLVKNGARYRDITVAARNIGDYEGYIKRIFPIYSIPVFADEKRPLAGHSVSRYVLSAMELAIYGYTHENVFSFAKNPFAPHRGDCGLLEGYCVEAGVRSWNWNEDFTFIRGAYREKAYGEGRTPESLQSINQLRREIVGLIEPLRECLAQSRSATAYARGLYDFIAAGALEANADKAAKEQEQNGDLRGAEETRQVYNLIMDILDDVCTVFGESVLDPIDFFEAVKTAFGAVQVGVVPPSSDSVIYGDIERMKGGKDRFVFVLGLNEDVFPRTFPNESIFTEYEAATLFENWGIELPPGTAEKTENEKLLVYDAISFAEKRLYLSYSMGKPDGQNLRPSSVIGRVKEIFPLLEETEDVRSFHGRYLCATKEAAFLELGSAMSERRGDRFWQIVYSTLRADPEYSAKIKLLENYRHHDVVDTQKLDPELLRSVTGDELCLSPSQLESYNGCPFSYFARHILRLREQTPMNINFSDSGNIIHNIIDGFCSKVVSEKGGDWRKVDDCYAKKAFCEVCAEIRGGISRQIAADPRLSMAVDRIERTAEKCIAEIRAQMTDEVFVPSGNEVIIGENGDIKPLSLQLPNGRRARITGRIDRTDVRRASVTDENGQQRMVELVRIVDYKSGNKKVDFGNILCGLQLQLFAYMDSYVADKDESLPAGAVYFHLSPTVKELAIGDETPEVVSRLAGVAVEGRMEGAEEVEEISPEDMDTVLDFVRKSMAATAERITLGEVAVSPAAEGDALKCDYCPFAGVCRFDREERPELVRPTLPCKKDEAVEKMKGLLE